MADGAQPIALGPRRVFAWRAFANVAPGWISLGFVLFLTFGTLVAVALAADGTARFGPADWAAIRFTILQAAVSAFLSIALAVPVARALARRRFPGRGLLITLLGAPFILPVIVAVLGLISVFGQNGLVSQLLVALGADPLRIYGFHGVVLAHVFFNLPLATRLLLQGWLAIPAERFRLAASLGFGPAQVQQHLEWPMLRAVLPGAAMVVFLICTTSFAVALTLGGGPRATTVELAIYQAFRFEFDLSKAALLALVQFGIGSVAAFSAYRASRVSPGAPGFDRVPARLQHRSWGFLCQDGLAIGLASLFLLLPLLAVIVRGAPHLFELPLSVFEALGRSILIALGSTALTVALALSLGLFALRARSGAAIEAAGYLAVSASPLVMGTGLFLLIFPFASPVNWALPVTAVVNAAMALPFALRSLMPELRGVMRDFGPLAQSLGLEGWPRLVILVLPRVRRPLGFAAGISAALSMGDLGVIALFADPDQATLPMKLFQLMGSYRMDQASGAAVLLLAVSLALFWVFDQGGRRRVGT